ncbi:UDP-N-acetylmuramoyl-L-alanine--D-glutamate ligase [Moraxella caviae]|uniref:UDP-N-acetylmuramoylalanine--D-glutamate ligase n=1 Tax=Moraxella caviae TaxID=34060 RepID=A0A1T0A0J1_9GAMM|nr:UDP-N-acetylmuramoyl-L-alanine--D-glutamate ligase [Moraxella caviae]OOR89266.1 UDP-N-acetylmuramoyl-L-alanine--D-glutamate ligase [Moraxella caviae]STZ13857.1 UDP-N-acetylmuramoylalanine--D-glutamate ligase [Moraxella caviae]VEW11185.1 UDP-N-acetylmuramoylalanine--D-glutamate ligase [Moraxella caviae]VEW12052.1 UDP-N-acetylmuramoylalanine--D-glutamate ligase [Moraxella caviae]
MAQHYAVVGLGGSGLSAVNFLVQQGFDVLVTDENPAPALAAKLPDGVTCAFGGLDKAALGAAQRIVISPGVDPRHEAIVAAKQAGIEVISDVQLFVETLKARDTAQGCSTPIVAITGSNAKSTVTTLVGEMAAHAGVVVGVGGNIGTPALELLKIDDLALVVLELSSFQLEHITNLGAQVATILNISADHLDRHGDMAGYLAAKLPIFEQAKSAVICKDDAELAAACEKALAGASIQTTCGEIGKACSADFCLVRDADDTIWLCHRGEKLLSADEIGIKGKHNLLNALSALALGVAVDLPMPAMLAALKAFAGLPHRCEYVGDVAGKVYFNDSKGTNIGSTLAAIDGLGAVYGERSLALILGGLAKGQDFAELSAAAERFTSDIYLIGQDTPIIREGLLAAPLLAERIHDVQTLQNAVNAANQSTAKAVLLSPACASFDQFSGYAERGETFVVLVKDLPN